MTDKVLVIGYGNELRGDDGVGPQVARSVADQNWPGVQAMAVHQLTPELAELLARTNIAVFVDAEAGITAVRVRPITSDYEPTAFGHTSKPAWLLGLTEAVFGYRPTAWLVTVPASDFRFGSGLSSVSSNGIGNALQAVEKLTIGLWNRSKV